MDPNIILLINALQVPVLTGLGALFGGWLVSSQLRRAGLKTPDRNHSSGELDWPRLMGLLATAWILLLGVVIGGVNLGSLLGDLAGMLSGLTIAGALLTGVAHHRQRRLHAAERSERPKLQKELRWLNYGAIAFAALAVTGLSISLPVLILLAGLGAVYVYSRPELRSQIESAITAMQAGQKLRTTKQLTVGDQLGEITVASPVGLTSTKVRDATGGTRDLPNDELLYIARDRTPS